MNIVNLLSTAIRYYSRKDIQNAIYESSINRECVPKLISNQELIFGKRPNVLNYPSDVIEFVKQRATSFHISEERWSNPMSLSNDLKPKELEKLRTGWDLIIDVDFPVFEGSKIIANEIIKALYEHGIRSISCKFSGNKGFHIGIPFEAMPKRIKNKETRLLFPELPMKILKYINWYIDNKQNNFKTSKKIEEVLTNINYKEKDKLLKKVCLNCNYEFFAEDKKEYIYLCYNCGNQTIKNEKEKVVLCEKCNRVMELVHISEVKCPRCGSKNITTKVDLGLDAILISKRHLFRSPYSLHEKSLLVSLPINPEDVMYFKKEYANPKEVKVKHKFLNKEDVKEDASKLLLQALDFHIEIDKKEDEKRIIIKNTNKINVEYFPPCIKKALNGLEDGRKRFLFIIINFLKKLNWKNEEIISLVKDWNNNKNPEPLRESIVNAQLRYHLKRDEMPPNCDRKDFYADIGICNPDALCKKIKNPVTYAIKKYLALNPKRRKK